jgi:hypothetical protein
MKLGMNVIQLGTTTFVILNFLFSLKGYQQARRGKF